LDGGHEDKEAMMRFVDPRRRFRLAVLLTTTLMAASVGSGVPAQAAAQLGEASLSASAESTNDSGTDSCSRTFTTSDSCSVARSGSLRDTSGSASASVQSTLGYTGQDLVLIFMAGSASGQATAAEFESAYGESSASARVEFDVVTPTLAIISGRLRASANGATPCSEIELSGPGTSLWIQAPGSECSASRTSGRLLEGLTLAPGAYVFKGRAKGGTSVPDGGGSASSSAEFDVNVQLITCANPYTDGDDVIEGTPGNDVLCGGAGNDTINGRGGNDRIFGGPGDDIISGGPGNDRIDAGEGNDVVKGGDGNDVLKGEDGNDKLLGEAGDDRITGGSGRDVMKGGPQRDDLRAKDGKRDRVDGGPGRDVATVDRVDRVTNVEVRR
jgi:Ca2+-binding RTX toxin-like protein